MKPSAPEGCDCLSPVLVVRSVEEETAFLQAVFQAKVGMLDHDVQGEAQRAEATISNSTLLLARASATHAATHSVLRIAVHNVQAANRLALENGGESVPLPNQASGEENGAAVSDPQGNIWWIVPRERRPSNEEVQRLLSEQRRQRL